MINIVVPSVWTNAGRTRFPGTEGALHDVIRQFAADNPEFHRRLLDEHDQPFTYLNICIDDIMVPRHMRAHTTVEADRTVTIISPMAGG
ncbi:MoaD/ThiS family protein [Dactylosporangium sp. CA-152071]|uniref:MoaD/ThiS family protein n=1 Tax=Dactylosporangium sp. CA-152071 TaxID=3239933 RepID=UPI003D93C402